MGIKTGLLSSELSPIFVTGINGAKILGITLCSQRKSGPLCDSSIDIHIVNKGHKCGDDNIVISGLALLDNTYVFSDLTLALSEGDTIYARNTAEGSTVSILVSYTGDIKKHTLNYDSVSISSEPTVALLAEDCRMNVSGIIVSNISQETELSIYHVTKSSEPSEYNLVKTVKVSCTDVISLEVININIGDSIYLKSKDKPITAQVIYVPRLTRDEIFIKKYKETTID